MGNLSVFKIIKTDIHVLDSYPGSFSSCEFKTCYGSVSRSLKFLKVLDYCKFLQNGQRSLKSGGIIERPLLINWNLHKSHIINILLRPKMASSLTWHMYEILHIPGQSCNVYWRSLKSPCKWCPNVLESFLFLDWTTVYEPVINMVNGLKHYDWNNITSAPDENGFHIF
jgi:hypothetical protein